MGKLLIVVTIIFFLVNAIFWGIMPHRLHCYVVENMGIQCPQHYVHILMSIASFLLGIAISQWSYIHYLRTPLKNQS